MPANFNITFLKMNDLDIFPLSSNPEIIKEVQIFYNCGEANFKYLVSKHYDGPNFMLIVESIANKSYFNFENQDMWTTFEHDFHFERCKMNFIFPLLGESEENEEGVNEDTPHYNIMTPTILLCVDFER